MRIALVIGSLERGGSERQVVEFVRAAHPAHAECVVICLGAEGPLAPAVREVGAKVVALGLRRIRPAGVSRLARALRRERPDVVYGFLFWGYTLALPLAALAVPRACRVAARRSMPDSDLPSREWAQGLRWIADRCSDAVIANSAPVADAWIEHSPALADRIVVIENGVRVAAPRGQESGRDEVLIVCVANLIHYKGHPTLLEALTRLRAEPRWRVLLVGDGPERGRVERTLVGHGLTEVVSLLGHRSDVDDLLSESDVAVLPSYTEGLPNAVLEAMAYGLPVVATDVGGVRGLLESGGGLIVPPRDPDALGRALQQMIDSPELRRTAGERGRELATTSFGIATMRDRTLAVMRTARERRGRRTQGRRPAPSVPPART